MMTNSHKFFCNKDCKYYPCHKELTDINCLFCFCPLYFTFECGGKWKALKNGYKDCSECTLPHEEHGYEWVLSKLKKGKKNEL